MPTPEEIERLNDAIDNLNQTRQRELEIIRAVNEARGEETRTAQAQLQLLDQQAASSREAAAQMAQLLAETNNITDATERAEKAYNEVVRQMQELQDRQSEGIELSRQEQEELARLTALRDQGRDSIIDNMQALQEHEQRVAENIERQAELTNSTIRLSDGFDDLFRSTLRLNAEWRDQGLGGSIAAVLTGGADMGELLDDMADKFTALSNPVELLGNMLVNTFANVQELGDLAASLRQVTGEGEEMTETFLDVHRSTMMMGLSAAQAKENIGTLYTEFVGFSSLTQESQERLSVLTAELGFLGVASDQVASSQDFLQMSLQMTSGEAEQTQKDLVALGKALKVPPGIIMKDFAAAQNVIGQFGKQGMKVFEELSAQAKATGVEMQGLINIAGGFDTFEDAADKVGSLNALLGGAYFDTMQMVSATEAERIELLRQGIEASGQQFDEMGRFQKKAIMSAAGITDMTEANKLFGNSLEAYYDQAAAAAVASGSLTDLTDAVRENMSITDKFTAIGNRMAFVVDSLIEVFDGFVDGILDAMAVLEPLFVVFEFVFGILGDLLAPLIKLITFLGTLYIAFKAIVAIAGFLGAALASPFLPVIAVIGAITAAVMFLYELFTEGPGFIVDFVEDFVSLIGDGIDIVVESIGDGIDYIISLPGRIYDGFVGLIDDLSNLGRDILVAVFGEDIGNTLADIQGVIFDALTSPFRGAIALISGFIDLVSSGFTNMGEGISSIFSGILEIIKIPFNLVLEGVNAVIRSLNTISFTVPEWVPMIGGEQFGFNIAEIPKFDIGGKVEKTGLAVIHEGETITPAKRVPGTEGGGPDTTSQLISKIDELINVIGSGANQRTAGGRNEVVLEVDGKRLGRVVYENFLKSKIEPVLDLGG